MTETVIISATREVVIGFDRPFVIIANAINPTGRKLPPRKWPPATSVASKPSARAGRRRAHMLDVNAGTARRRARDPRARRAARAVDHRCASVDRLIDRRRAGRGSRGVPGKAPSLGDRRGRSARDRPATGQEYGLPSSRSRTTRRVFPKTRTCASRWRAGSCIARWTTAFRRPTSSSIRSSCRSARSTRPACSDALVRLCGELKVNTTWRASNVSFGLPNRDASWCFLTMAISAGLTSAITNPCTRTSSSAAWRPT